MLLSFCFFLLKSKLKVIFFEAQGIQIILILLDAFSLIMGLGLACC